MRVRLLPLSPALAAALALAPPASAQAPAGEVTIYRCTGADGSVSIGNVPCAGDDREETRGMVRPVDAPPRAAARAPEADATAVPAPVQVVVVRDAQPMYECTTIDGERYDSDDGDGNPRWVPYWTTGYPSAAAGVGHRVSGGVGTGGAGVSAPGPSGVSVPGPSGISVPGPAGVSAPLSALGGRSHPGAGRPPPHRPRPPGGWRDDYGGGGVWIRDDCRRLPQAEACARLDDRLDALRRRFFNAQQRERDVLRVEERGLVARIAQDCGRH